MLRHDCHRLVVVCYKHVFDKPEEEHMCRDPSTLLQARYKILLKYTSSTKREKQIDQFNRKTPDVIFVERNLFPQRSRKRPEEAKK